MDDKYVVGLENSNQKFGEVPVCKIPVGKVDCGQKFSGENFKG